MANRALGAAGRGGPAGPRGGWSPRIATLQARTRAEPRESPLFCVRARKAALGREFGGKPSAEPARPPAPSPLRPGWGRAGRGPGARAVPAAHPPANLERCGRSRLQRPAEAAGAAARRLPGTAPGRRASPGSGNNGVRAGAVRAGGALDAGVRAGGGARGGLGEEGSGSLFGFGSGARCGGVLPPGASPWDGWGRGKTHASPGKPGRRGASPC